MIRPMEHPTIDQEQVLDHYLADQLEPEDEAAFEEHLFACADCLRQVQAGEELRRGLAEVAASEAQDRVESTAPSSVMSGSGAPGSGAPGQGDGAPHQSSYQAWRRLAIAAMLIVAPLGVLALRGVDYSRQLASAEEQLGTMRRSLDITRSELETLRRSSSRVRPAAALRLLPLGVSRAGDGAAVPVLEPAEDSDAPWVISLQLAATPEFPLADAYSLRLLDDAGAVRFEAQEVEPTPYESLLVILPQGFLEAGDYVFEVFVFDALAGEPGTPVARLPLRVDS